MSIDLITRGSTIISRSLVAILIIQFFILRQAAVEDREYSGRLTEARQRLLGERVNVSAQLRCLDRFIVDAQVRTSCEQRIYDLVLEDRVRILDRLTKIAPDDQRSPRRMERRARDGPPIEGQILQRRLECWALVLGILTDNNLRDSCKDPRSNLVRVDYERSFDRLAKIDADILSLSKARPRRDFKIPGTDSSIEEGDIRMLYPAALALLIVVILVFRRLAIERMPVEDRLNLPYWSAPLPVARGMNFWIRLAKNSLGFTVLLSLAYLYLVYMYRDDVYQSANVFLLNAAVGAIALCLLIDCLVSWYRASTFTAP